MEEPTLPRLRRRKIVFRNGGGDSVITPSQVSLSIEIKILPATTGISYHTSCCFQQTFFFLLGAGWGGVCNHRRERERERAIVVVNKPVHQHESRAHHHYGLQECPEELETNHPKCLLPGRGRARGYPNLFLLYTVLLGGGRHLAGNHTVLVLCISTGPLMIPPNSTCD